jgi:hypothetical protein
MPRFYQIAQLTAGRGIHVSAGSVTVDLDACDALVENDADFRAAVAPDTWFWISGGGTLLLNGRYLVVVRRSPDARVNPGKFSLFTGRADNAQERVDPSMLVREMFEELLLFEGGTLLMPRLDGHEAMIATAYNALREVGVLAGEPNRVLDLTPLPLATRQVRIRHGGTETERALSWAVGSANDVNALFLFGAECDVFRLRGRDGEFHMHGDLVVRADRALYLLDVTNGSAAGLLPGMPTCVPPREDMTYLLQTVLEEAARGPRWRV